MTTLADRIREIRRDLGMETQQDLADAIGCKRETVTMWESGETHKVGGKYLGRLLEIANVRGEWVQEGKLPKRPQEVNRAKFGIAEADEGSGFEIELSTARGSCGGGAMPEDYYTRPPLIKEPSWFKRYKIKPDECLAVWADGDSMSNFIVDGDIVIFNRTKTTPRSGQIFLIDHPDGLRIKRLRREVDGTWVLESDNADKRRFPDERIAPSMAEHLKVLGEFVYRQGG